jgi:hypothetical protein
MPVNYESLFCIVTEHIKTKIMEEDNQSDIIFVLEEAQDMNEWLEVDEVDEFYENSDD